MNIRQQLNSVSLQCRSLATSLAVAPYPACILFFSISDMTSRAHVFTVTGQSFDEAWEKGTVQAEHYCDTHNLLQPRLRIDVVDQIESLTWQQLKSKLSRTKRNYFRFGLAFDCGFECALLEQEFGANAILYDGDNGVATANARNLAHYTLARFGHAQQWPAEDNAVIWRFKTKAVYVENGEVFPIENEGRNSGYRRIHNWQESVLESVIQQGSQYLAEQVKASGEYYYGWFPCFDKPVRSYNALRHASSTYALIESWEVTGEASQREAIERALNYLSHTLIRCVALPDGEQAAFLIDVGDEIKLGGNAVSILALAKYTEVTGDRKYIVLMEQLAAGISFMQNKETGRFVHVLNASDLSVKNPFRIIYYDGEAAFALMRLYAITENPRWLTTVEKAFDDFIERQHWKSHDHWLSYCVNELTRYRPEEKYFRFGLQNVSGHLDFVLNRVTTYPTLLELMMAASKMITRLQNDPQHVGLLDDFDCEKFAQALEHRARYLLNGFFWPEIAMFFKHPQRISGSFFIRHHSYRVRIDDVEHYLSGYVAYLNHYIQKKKQQVSLRPAKQLPQRLVFLTGDIRNIGNGIEIAVQRRVSLFRQRLNVSPLIITSEFNPRLRENIAVLKAGHKFPQDTQVLNLYEQLPRLLAEGKISPLPAGEQTTQKDDFAEQGNPIISKMRQYALPEQGPDFYAEDYVDNHGNILLRKCFQRHHNKMVLRSLTLLDAKKQPLTFNDKSSFYTFLLYHSLSKDVFWHFVVDKNEPYKNFVCSSPRDHFACTLTAVLHSTHQLADGRYKQTYRHLLENAGWVDKLIVLTHEQANDLVQIGFPKAQMDIIPNHIDEQALLMGQQRQASQTVIYLARYSPEKRHHLLLRVFKQVLEHCPQARLETYGTGPLRKEIQEACQQMGLQQAVSINGYTQDIADVHRNAACAVLCSNQEGLSIFALECMAFGTPLVSFAVKYGPLDIIGESRSGILVPDPDESALAKAIIKVISQPELQSEMGKAALINAQRFSTEQIAAHWQRWFREMTRLATGESR